jgi:hypothetical protein
MLGGETPRQYYKNVIDFGVVCAETHSSCGVERALLCDIDGITVCFQLAQFIFCQALID